MRCEVMCAELWRTVEEVVATLPRYRSSYWTTHTKTQGPFLVSLWSPDPEYKQTFRFGGQRKVVGCTVPKR